MWAQTHRAGAMILAWSHAGVNRVQTHHVIEFSGHGYFFQVFVSKHRKPDYVYSLGLKENGSLCLPHIYHEERGSFRKTMPIFSSLAKKFPQI